jgi:hypothetical protein
VARKARVYHRRPVRTRRGASETPCIVSFDGGTTFEEFKNAPPKEASAKHKIVQLTDGSFGLIEKKLR